MTGRWTPGTTIVHHEVWKGRVWAARPLVVVEDTDELILLWLPQGTVRQVPSPPPDAEPVAGEETRRGTEASHRGVVENLRSGAWSHTEHVWDVSSLWLLRPGDGFAVWVSWLAGAHLGWYVNLQRPYRRTAVGIEAMDLMLDVVVEPDRSWRYKDAAELEVLARDGTFDAGTVASVHAAAAQAITLVETGAEPFCDPWPAWRPDPAWPRPVLPPDWAEVPA